MRAVGTLFGKPRSAETYQPQMDDVIEDQERDSRHGPTAAATRTGRVFPTLGTPPKALGAVAGMMMLGKARGCGAGPVDIESDSAGLLTGKKKRWALGSVLLIGMLIAWGLTAAVVVVVDPTRRVKVAEVTLDVDLDSGKVGREGLQALFGLAEAGAPLAKVKLGAFGSGGRRLQAGGAETLRVDLLERVNTEGSAPTPPGLALLMNRSNRTDPAEEDAATSNSDKNNSGNLSRLDVVRVEGHDGELLGHVLCEDPERPVESCTMIPEEENALGDLFLINGSGNGSGTGTWDGSSSSGGAGDDRGFLRRLLEETVGGGENMKPAGNVTAAAVSNVSIRKFLRVRAGTWDEGDDTEQEVPPNEEEDLEEKFRNEEEGLSFEVKPGDEVLAHFRTGADGAKSKEPAVALVVSVEAEGEELALRLDLDLSLSGSAGAAEALQTVPRAWVMPLENEEGGAAAAAIDGGASNGTPAKPRRACAIGCQYLPEDRCWQKDECRSKSWNFMWHLYRAASKIKGEWRFRFNRGETTCTAWREYYGYAGCGGTGDIEDAMQHAMYTAILAGQAGSGSDAQAFMDGRERDPGRSRPSMISSSQYQDDECGKTRDADAIMDLHNNYQGRKLAERLRTRVCGFTMCEWRYYRRRLFAPRQYGDFGGSSRRCWCVYYKWSWPSANKIAGELLGMFKDARYITDTTTSTYDDGRLWFKKNSCHERYSGCNGHGRCRDSRCVCDNDWTGSACGYNQRRRRAPWWQRVGCVPGETLLQTPEGPTPAQEVAVGDRLLTSAGFQDVYLLGHQARHALENFVQLTLSTNQTVELSPLHYIEADGRHLHAKDVARGMQLSVVPLHPNSTSAASFVPARVVSSRLVLRRGLYNPYTLAGDYVAGDGGGGGVLVSAHSEWFLEGWVAPSRIPGIYQRLLAPVRWLYQAAPAWVRRFHDHYNETENSETCSSSSSSSSSGSSSSNVSSSSRVSCAALSEAGVLEIAAAALRTALPGPQKEMM